MNEEIMRFSSDWFYGNQVESAPEVKYRSILDLDIPMTWVDTSKLPPHSLIFKEEFVGESFGRINKAEAELTLMVLENYFKKIGKERILDERLDVGIISPYRAQVQYLRHQLKKKEWAKALQYIGQAERWTNPHDTIQLSSARTIRTETYMMQHRYDEVTALADSILACKNIHTNDRTTVLGYLIEIFTERGEYAKALAYSSEALATASARNKPWLYDKLATIYQRQGRHQLALQMKDSVIYYKDSLSMLHDHQLSENERIREDVIQLRSDMERNETYLRQHRYIIGLLICVILLIALIAYQRTRILRSKNQQDKRLMEMEMEHQRQERLLMERQMKEAELTALHEQEVARHKQQITELSLEQKKRELSATTLFVSSRNALIEDLLKSLAEVAKTSSSPKLNELMLHLKHMLQDHEKSNDFLINFESANPDFIHRIKERHPDLTTSDLRFLAFLRMNLSTKEIASFMGITPDSCKRRKIRLSQKLQLPTSSDLSAYVMQF